MPSFGMLYREALVRTDVSGERIAAIMMVTRIDLLATSALTVDYTTVYSIVHYSIL
jgi:hypothetical protein